MDWRVVLERGCVGKRRMGHGRARRVAAELDDRRPKGEPHIGCYRCPLCSGYHVGHVPSIEGLQSIADAIRARAQDPAA